MKKMVRKIIIFFVIFALNSNIFASVVSDNDGSAFITKAEYDSLKNDFQSQLDSYNSGIDNKIDAAISSYLAGITISKSKIMSPNIEEIEYPIEIIHHKKNIEEADDNITTDFPQETPLWRPSWKLMTLNVRGDYRIYDKFQYPQIDNVGTFVAGYNYDNNYYKLTGSVSGFVKTSNFFYLLDGWPYNSNFLTYIIVADCNNGGDWGLYSNANQWMDRSSYIVSSYKDLFKYSGYETNLYLTNFSANQSKADNKSKVSSSENWKKWKSTSTILYHGPNHGSKYLENGNTIEYGTPNYKTTFSKIYNNNTGNALAPVSYYLADSSGNYNYELYYTNKQKNRIFYQYDSTGVQNNTWSFNIRDVNTTYNNRGVSGILTRGYNLESELENTSRNWYNKSLIKQTRIIYDFSSKSKTVENHRMGDGVPLLIFDKSSIGGDNYEKVKINFHLSTDYSANKKYIVFSKQPILLNDYSTDVDSDLNYEIIKESNGTTWTTNKRKVELVNGENSIVLNDFRDKDVLYYKILWNTTNTKGGTNYNDELVTISDPLLEITYK